MMSAPAVIGNDVKLVPVTIFSATAPWNEANRSALGTGRPPPIIFTIGEKNAAMANSTPTMIGGEAGTATLGHACGRLDVGRDRRRAEQAADACRGGVDRQDVADTGDVALGVGEAGLLADRR